ncbi:MAG: hypothetical protein ACYDB3_06810 [Acidimicrobiales bacterium]
MRHRVLAIMVALVAIPALAALPGAVPSGASSPTLPPAPTGCSPTPLRSVASLASGTNVCIDNVLVVATSGGTFTLGPVDDSQAPLGTQVSANVNDWWAQGTPVSGMVVTLWGVLDAKDVVQVTRWIDETHGSGPTPLGPYPQVSELDVASGRLPQGRMVWIEGTVFAEIPQAEPGGDGDVHVQMMSPCPGAGVTTESTPPLRGYVDQPARAPDLPLGVFTNWQLDDPPLGAPVMVLGAVRYDPGYGWYELHPIRAWRYPTSAELKTAVAQCANDPLLQVNSANSIAPLPYGAPSCGQLPVAGVSTPGEQPCGSVCSANATTIGNPETLSGPCTGISPVETDNLVSWLDHESVSQSYPAFPPLP